MASWAEEAAELAQVERWYVCREYRHCRERQRLSQVGALCQVQAELARQSTRALLAGEQPLAMLRARQYAYAQVLLHRALSRASSRPETTPTA